MLLEIQPKTVSYFRVSCWFFATEKLRVVIPGFITYIVDGTDITKQTLRGEKDGDLPLFLNIKGRELNFGWKHGVVKRERSWESEERS